MGGRRRERWWGGAWEGKREERNKDEEGEEGRRGLGRGGEEGTEGEWNKREGKKAR